MALALIGDRLGPENHFCRLPKIAQRRTPCSAKVSRRASGKRVVLGRPDMIGVCTAWRAAAREQLARTRGHSPHAPNTAVLVEPSDRDLKLT